MVRIVQPPRRVGQSTVDQSTVAVAETDPSPATLHDQLAAVRARDGSREHDRGALRNGRNEVNARSFLRHREARAEPHDPHVGTTTHAGPHPAAGVAGMISTGTAGVGGVAGGLVDGWSGGLRPTASASRRRDGRARTW